MDDAFANAAGAKYKGAAADAMFAAARLQ